MKGAIGAVAGAFRIGATGQASEGLTQFVDALSRGLPAMGARAHALLPALARVLAAQERGDYAALADVLEYELAPLLGG